MRSIPELRPLIEMYLAAFRAVVHGPHPGENDSAAPHLDSWTPVLRGEQLCLIGQVTGHPHLGDTSVSTSALIYVTEDQQCARTLSRWYRLGAPLAVDTSAAFPDVVLGGYCVPMGADALSLPLKAARRLIDKRPQLIADKAFELGFDDLVPALTLLARAWPSVARCNSY